MESVSPEQTSSGEPKLIAQFYSEKLGDQKQGDSFICIEEDDVQ